MKIIQQLRDVKFGCRLVSFLFMLALVMGWKNIYLGFAIQSSSIGSGLFLMALSLLFLILNLMAATGLYRLKKWSFIFAYIAILFSTFFLSTSYIPFVPRLAPDGYSWLAMMCINFLLALYLIYLDLTLRRKE